MASRLLRNIAIGIGAGLAAGFGRSLVSRRVAPIPNLYPILDRLEDIASRVTRVEIAPAPMETPTPEEIVALGTLVSSQSEDIASLRQDIQRIDRRTEELAEAFGQRVAMLEIQVPKQIEARISTRMAELEQKLRGEFQEVHLRTVDAFSEAIEKRVVGRINVLETSLIDQAQSVAALREKSLKTDENLQRLLGAVERLCAKAEAQAPVVQRPVEPPTAPPPSPVAQPPAQPSSPAAEPEPAPHFAASNGTDSNFRAVPRMQVGFKPIGMAVLGLVVLGFRLAR